MFKMIHSGNDRGFTLIELLIVIAIIGILGGIAIPLFLGQRTKAMLSEAKTNIRIIATANENFYAENGRYSPWPGRVAGAVGTSTYRGTPAIESELRGVKFGDEADLNFTYTLQSCLLTGQTGSEGQAFLVKATGKPGSAMDGTILSINERNEVGDGTVACGN